MTHLCGIAWCATHSRAPLSRAGAAQLMQVQSSKCALHNYYTARLPGPNATLSKYKRWITDCFSGTLRNQIEHRHSKEKVPTWRVIDLGCSINVRSKPCIFLLFFVKVDVSLDITYSQNQYNSTNLNSKTLRPFFKSLYIHDESFAMKKHSL